MSEWLDATGDPDGFVKAVQNNQKVYANFSEDRSLQWNGEHLLYVYPDHRWKGEYRDSLFPAMFKRSHERMKDIFAFFDTILKLNGEK